MKDPAVEPPPSAGSISAPPHVLDDSSAGGLLIRGAFVRLVAYAAAIGLSVLSTALLSRHLGVSRFGQYTTVLSLVAIVAAITDAGMWNFGAREYAVRRGADRDALMRDLLGLRVCLTLVGVLFVCATTIGIGYRISVVVGAVTASLATVALVVQHTFSIPLTTDLRLGWLAALDLGRQVISVAAIVALVVLGAGIFPLLAVPLVANIILILPTRLLSGDRISVRLSLRPRAWVELFRVAVVFSLASAVGVMYAYAAQVLTSVVTSRYQSGVFAVSFRVFIVAAGVPGLLVGAGVAFLSRAASQDSDRFAYALGRTSELLLLGSVGAALVTSAGSQFIISVVGGPKYSASAAVLGIQAYAMIATFVAAGAGFGLLSLRLHREILVANALALGVITALTLLLAAKYGAIGAAIATVCGESTLAAGLFLALLRVRANYKPRIRVVVAVVVAGAVSGVASYVPTVPSVARALIAAAVYVAIIIVIGGLPPEVRELSPIDRLPLGRQLHGRFFAKHKQGPTNRK